MIYYTQMLPLSQMIIRLVLAMVLGAMMGLEREIIGKEAGIRTAMLVAGGAAIFAMMGLTLPFIMIQSGMAEANAGANGALGAVANIVIGVGFLGAGIIFKDKERVHGLTTAAVVWATAAIGALAGLGLLRFAVIAGVLIPFALYFLRKTSIQPGKR